MSDLEDEARRIAGRGRDALVARLRPAFREAAQAHQGDGLDDQQLEELVQQAADEADGLQWRRALAAVAMDELGLELGEALLHPAVARAQEIVAAPSYDDAVAALGMVERQYERRTEDDLGPEHEEDLDADAVTGEEVALEAATGESIAVWAATGPPGEPSFGGHTPTQTPLQLVCTHIGGIADLASPEPGVELWFSEHGLDIVRPTREPLGRLRWEEVRAIEVVAARGRFALRRSVHSYLVIRGVQGDASFELHDATPAELREQLAGCAGEKVPIV